MTWRLPDPGPVPPGRVRVDCHVHTVHSGDAVSTVEQIAKRVAAERIDVLCVTDHHSLDGAWEAVERDIGARVVVGEEIRTRAGEVIGLFLAERIPYVLPLPEVVRRIRDQRGVIYAPHPLDPNRTSLGAEGLRELHEHGALDVVEVCNAKISDPEHNAAAANFAARNDIPAAAGSDAHDPQGIGAAYLHMPDFDGPTDFLRKLPEARIWGEHRDHVGWQPGRGS
ncbi:PHP-associated domain-containing protein [Saccharopolyspora elongata]|uniref:PHP-associated domain-containing protein n=1 Tax=Saccharopolyspora elongata TaxID=2530387 RepID=UPI001404CB61|nr:PHP domain-containing protein [Saccharopolyspora elongata]